MKISVKNTALSLASLFALWHLVWIILVAIFGEGVIDYVSGLHFVTGLAALPLNIGSALLGIVQAFIGGLIVGAVFAWIWNKLEK